MQDPAKLYKLIVLIHAEEWVLMGVKDKGDIYEGLLAKPVSILQRLVINTIYTNSL